MKGCLPSVRLSFNFAAYYDDIHADTDLAPIWTKGLTLDENMLDILIPEEELSSL